MSNDWRLTIELGEHAAAEHAERALADVLGPAHEISRVKSALCVYADEESEAEGLSERVGGAVAELGAAPRVLIERWNSKAGRWQDPSLPVEELDEEPDPFEIDFDALHFQVVVQTPERLPKDIESRLMREGIAAFAKGSGAWLYFFKLHHRLWCGARSADEAEALAERLRLEVPPGSTVRIEPLTRWRRWRAREALVGGYAASAGP